MHSPGSTPSAHQRFFALFRRERADLAVIVLFAVVSGVLYLATPLAVDAVVNNISFGGQQPVYLQTLLILAFALLVFLVVMSVVSAAQFFVVELLQQRLFVRVAADLAYRLPRLEYGALERTKRPELVNRFLDVVTVQKSAASLLLDGVNVVLSMGIGLLVLAFYHPFLVAFDLVLVLGLVLVLFPLGRNGVRTSIEESYAKHAVAGWFEQVVLFPVLFKNGAAAQLASARTDHLVGQYLTARRDHFRVLLRQIAGLLALQAVASALLLALGGMLVLQGELTLGQLVASELIVSAIVASLVSLGKHVENWYDALAAADKLGSLVDLPVEREEGQGGSREPSGALSVEALNLTFAYPGLRPLFEGMDLRVSAGERVAITGPIGSGAGTILDLIYGLRLPAEGVMRVDGVDLRSWRLEDLRSQVVLIREPEFVEGTLEENVSLGREDLGASEVHAALEAVGFGSALVRLPDGLATRLQPGGRPLSDAQRVQVCLARAVAWNPRLLLIDKLLDGLDSQVAEQMMSAVFDPSRRWTVLVATRDERVMARCTRVHRLPAVDVRVLAGVAGSGATETGEGTP